MTDDHPIDAAMDEKKFVHLPRGHGKVEMLPAQLDFAAWSMQQGLTYAIRAREFFRDCQALFLGERRYVKNALLHASKIEVFERLAGAPIITFSGWCSDVIKGDVSKRMTWKYIPGSPLVPETAKHTMDVPLDASREKNGIPFRIHFPESARQQVLSVAELLQDRSSPSNEYGIIDALVQDQQVDELLKIAALFPLEAIEYSLHRRHVGTLKVKALRSWAKTVNIAMNDVVPVMKSLGHKRVFVAPLGEGIIRLMLPNSNFWHSEIDAIASSLGQVLFDKGVIADEKPNPWAMLAAASGNKRAEMAMNAMLPQEEPEVVDVAVPVAPPQEQVCMVSVVAGMPSTKLLEEAAGRLGGRVLDRRTARNAVFSFPEGKMPLDGLVIRGLQFSLLILHTDTFVQDA
jgi:hypothetical protein